MRLDEPIDKDIRQPDYTENVSSTDEPVDTIVMTPEQSKSTDIMTSVEPVKNGNEESWKTKVSTWLSVETTSPQVERFIVAMKTLLRDQKFAGARNVKTVLETIARLGFLPIPEHMTFTVNKDNDIMLFPSARGLTFAILNSGIVKDIECEVVYAPDMIMFPVDVYKMSDEEPSKSYLLKMIEPLTPDVPIIVKKSGDVGELQGSVCKIITNENKVIYHVMRKTELVKIRQGFAQCPNSKAWVNSESEMYKKVHIKRAVKYEFEKQSRVQVIPAENCIDFDNDQEFTVNDNRQTKIIKVDDAINLTLKKSEETE